MSSIFYFWGGLVRYLGKNTQPWFLYGADIEPEAGSKTVRSNTEDLLSVLLEIPVYCPTSTWKDRKSRFASLRKRNVIFNQSWKGQLIFGGNRVYLCFPSSFLTNTSCQGAREGFQTFQSKRPRWEVLGLVKNPFRISHDDPWWCLA